MKEDIPTLHVNLDAKCQRCGKGGATQNGLCLPCITKAIKAGEFDHIFKRTREEAKRKLRGLNDHNTKG